jgi:hypothetical protein
MGISALAGAGPICIITADLLSGSMASIVNAPFRKNLTTKRGAP